MPRTSRNHPKAPSAADNPKDAPDLSVLLKELQEIKSATVGRMQAQAVRDRFEMYRAVWHVTPDQIEAVRLALREFVDEDEAEEWAGAPEEKLKRIFSGTQIYEYLYYSELWRRLFGTQLEIVFMIDLWIRELGTSEEFRIVHLRQGRYYPDYSALINRVLLDSARFIEAQVREARVAEPRLQVERTLLRELQASWERQMAEARFMTETACLQVVEAFYYAYMERTLDAETTLRLKAEFATTGLPFVPIDRAVFRRLLRPRTDFLIGEIERQTERVPRPA
ncbi:MAG TPA: hypothetical protein VFE33_08420 [Thermoanaerobaculia bacterium]|nr:hypothetical protein [Thermoanaerobaculia bacterium]